MSPLIKLVVGLAGTSLIAYAAYKLTRAPLLSDLGSRSADVMIANGITDGRANWVTATGWTFRVARLSGTADAATRIRTRNAVAALAGVSDAVWEDEGTATSGADPAIGAIGVADCQARVDAINAGQRIGFGDGDATIDAASLRRIDAIAQTLQRCPDAAIDVIGAGGASAVDRALSQARAEAVATALTMRSIAGARLAATTGKASSASPDRRGANSRPDTGQRNAPILFVLHAPSIPGESPL